jgi:hypothetical protein
MHQIEVKKCENCFQYYKWYRFRWLNLIENSSMEQYLSKKWL